MIDPYREIVEAPAGCEIAVREKDGVKYLFVLNYGKEPAKVVLKQQAEDLFAGCKAQGVQTVEGYGTRVYEV